LCDPVTKDWEQIGCLTTTKIVFSNSKIDVTPWAHDGFRNFVYGKKSWTISGEFIYNQDDEQQEELEEAYFLRQRILVKFVPNTDFDGLGNKRRARGGFGFVMNLDLRAPTRDLQRRAFTIVGCGVPFDIMETETSSESCLTLCCIDVHQGIYLQNGIPFKAPDAPEGSIGWIVEKNFEAVETGTGNIGFIEVDSAGGSAGADGCPVFTTFRYLCVDSAIVPTESTAGEEFVEIAEKTNNPGQIAIIEKMQELTGLRLNVNDVTYYDIWFEFNFVYLPNNPSEIIDFSALGLSDGHIIETLTNLKNVDLSFNNLIHEDVEEWERINLNYLDISHNLIGQENKVFVFQAATLTHFDLSHNYLVEAFLYNSGDGQLNPPTMNFYDLSYNFIGAMLSDTVVIRDFRMIFNTYPDDDTYGAPPFWTPRKVSDANSSIYIADPTHPMKNLTIVQNLDLSSTELDDPDADIPALVTAVATAQSISTAAAEQIVIYDPTFLESPRAAYNPFNLSREGT